MVISKYSQGNEEAIIIEYLNSHQIIPNILSIGENTGIHLSNCRRLIENGASAILVEPSQKAFAKLNDLYYGHYDKVWCFNVAIGNEVGEADFYESGEHLGKGDIALLSSLKKETTTKWLKSTEFNKGKALVWTFEELQKNVKSLNRPAEYQFINIDAEGFDLEILKQIDLNEVDCQCLCIEHNSVLSVVQEIREYCTFFGLNKEIGYNAENIILCR